MKKPTTCAGAVWLGSTALVAAVLVAAWARGGDLSLRAHPTYRVPIRNLALRARVLWAVEGAAERLQQPGCLQVFSDFTDEGGVTIQNRLEGSGLEAHQHLH